MNSASAGGFCNVGPMVCLAVSPSCMVYVFGHVQCVHVQSRAALCKHSCGGRRVDCARLVRNQPVRILEKSNRSYCLLLTVNLKLFYCFNLKITLILSLVPNLVMSNMVKFLIV